MHAWSKDRVNPIQYCGIQYRQQYSHHSLIQRYGVDDDVMTATLALIVMSLQWCYYLLNVKHVIPYICAVLFKMWCTDWSFDENQNEMQYDKSHHDCKQSCLEQHYKNIKAAIRNNHFISKLLFLFVLWVWKPRTQTRNPREMLVYWINISNWFRNMNNWSLCSWWTHGDSFPGTFVSWVVKNVGTIKESIGLDLMVILRYDVRQLSE